MKLRGWAALLTVGHCIVANYTFHKFCIIAIKLFDRFTELRLGVRCSEALQLFRRIHTACYSWLGHGGGTMSEGVSTEYRCASPGS